jgi:hypothetical protein
MADRPKLSGRPLPSPGVMDMMLVMVRGVRERRVRFNDVAVN